MLTGETKGRFSEKRKTESKAPREAQTNFMRNREAVRETRVVSLDILPNPPLSPDMLTLNSNAWLHFYHAHL